MKYNRTYLGFIKTVVELKEKLERVPPDYKIYTYDGYIEFYKDYYEKTDKVEYFEVETPQ